MGKDRDGLIKFLIKGFIAIGVIMALYLILYTFFYDSRRYILNLYKVIDILFIKAKLNFTGNFYVNLFIVYLIGLSTIYALGQYIKGTFNKKNVNRLRLGKGTKMSKSSEKMKGIRIEKRY